MNPVRFGLERTSYVCLMEKSGGQKSRATVPLSEVGAFHWPPKNHYSLDIGLTLYKSIGINVRLYASAKVRDTQYCKLGGQGLKKLLCPLGA
jgi:hypothetical protein